MVGSGPEKHASTSNRRGEVERDQESGEKEARHNERPHVVVGPVARQAQRIKLLDNCGELLLDCG